MELGVRLPNGGAAAHPENLARLATAAQEIGYRTAWVGDHVILPERVESLYPYAADGRWTMPATTNYVDPLLALAWAGAAAPRLRLGTSVLVAPMRHPVLLAKQVASLDHLTGGRVVLGFGAGWMREEFDLVEAPFGTRGQRVDEMVRLMRDLWTGTSVDFEGRFWRVRDGRMWPRPAQGAVPIVWGGHSDAVLRRVARLGDGWHPSMLDAGVLEERLGKLHTYCGEEGRDPATLEIIVRPPSYDTGTLRSLEQLSVDEVLVFPTFAGPEIGACIDEIAAIAAIARA